MLTSTPATRSVPSRLLGLLAVLALVAGAAVTGAGGSFRAASSPTLPELLPPMEPGNTWFAGQIEEAASAQRRAQAQAMARREARGVAKRAGMDPTLAPYAELDWALAGPVNVGGRVTDLAVPVGETNVVYVATASGGVWRSADAGLSFEPVWPAHFNQAIGALAVTSDGTLFAGTGEANPGGGSIVFGGDGIYRSTDGGGTWDHVGLATSGAIGRIVVDPTDDDHLWVAASGDLFVPGGERGLYETRDGGETWDLVLAGDNDTTGAIDIAVDATDPGHLLVAMWDHQREPDLRRYGGPGSALYLTTDGGETWERLGEDHGLPGGDQGRIGVAIAPSVGDVAYAIVVSPEGPMTGFYASLDGGRTWEPREERTPDLLAMVGFSQSSYGWWFGRIWIDPVDPLRLWVAGVALMSSADGGITTVPNAGPHADHHAMAWDPNVPGRVYLGNDGGVYRHDANGAANVGWVWSPDQPWTQHYSVDISQQDATKLVSGLQDNGVNRSWGGPSYNGVNAPTISSPVPLTVPVDEATPDGWWNEYVGGDGLAAVVDPSDDDILYGCSQYGNCSRSTDGGDSSGGMTKAPGTRFGWFPPIVLDPTDPSVIWTATDFVSYSTDEGRSWTTVSDDLAYGADDDYDQPVGRDATYAFGTATALAVGTDGQTIWVGTDNGKVWRSDDRGGDLFFEVDLGLTRNDWITRITPDPEDPQAAWIAVSGFRAGSDAARILYTPDGGRTVTDVSGNLPSAPVHDVLVLGDLLVAALDVGVFVSVDGGSTWGPLGTSLPMAPAMDLAFSVDGNTLAVATFGRGVWTVSLAVS